GVGKAGKRAASVAAEKIQAKLALGDLSPLQPAAPPAPTLREYAQRWLSSEATLRLKPITAERYTIVVNRHLLPAFGDTRVPDLTRSALKTQLAAWLANGKVRGSGPLRPGTVRLLVATLRAVLNTAMEDGLISTNPASRLGRFVRADGAIEDEAPDPFTADEVQALLGVAEREYPEWHPFSLTMARTGLRIGECLALQRDDVDVTRRTLWIRRTWTRGRLGTTKGGRSRAVDLSPQAVQVLRDWMSIQETEAVVEGKPLSPWLFPSPTGGPWDDRWLRWHIWRPLLRRAGLRHRGPHQLRHSYASLLIAAGAHPKYIQAQLGHASITVTMDVYGHLFPGTFARLVDALDDATARNLPATAPAMAAKLG
ncbi:MAG TPA: site-specific integrase, partial [Methylomirabilota bacterium]|nr:site-specific integrase [Methylomirabilota bacterium]